MTRLFLGKAWHWLGLIALFAVLWWMGEARLQTRDYNLFLSILLAATALLVAAILLFHRRGERITREPFDEDGE